MITTANIRADQRAYVASQGGLLSIREGDSIYNNYNRQFCRSFVADHPAAVIGNINFYGNDRRDIIAGTKSPCKEYHGEHLLNFSCDFILPERNEEIESLIRKWNQGGEGALIESVTTKILTAGGEMLIWY